MCHCTSCNYRKNVFFKFESLCVTILDCNYCYSEWKHCRLTFLFLLPPSNLFSLFIALFSLLSKNTQTSYIFLTLYIYWTLFTTHYYYTITLIYKNIIFFSFNVKMFFFLGWKKKRIKCIPFFPQKRQQPTTSQQPQWFFTTHLGFQLAHQQLQFQWQLRYQT